MVTPTPPHKGREAVPPSLPSQKGYGPPAPYSSESDVVPPLFFLKSVAMVTPFSFPQG